MEVNAACPGVSRKLMISPRFVSTWYAPICCVIPPASPAVTLVSLIASSKDVLPWSTCPIIVTTAGLGFRSDSASFTSLITSSTSASETLKTLCPNSSTINSAVSASITWFWVTIIPIFISALTTSATRSAILLANSETTMASGI